MECCVVGHFSLSFVGGGLRFYGELEQRLARPITYAFGRVRPDRPWSQADPNADSRVSPEQTVRVRGRLGATRQRNCNGNRLATLDPHKRTLNNLPSA